MSEDEKIVDAETVAEKKKRLRIARELADELREEQQDDRYLQRSVLRKMSREKGIGSDIYLKYAMAILDKVLESDRVDVLIFAQGNSDEGKEMRKRVCFSVSNMASDLTKQHLSLYP